MAPRAALPLSASCNVARMRMSVDLPAPLGPRSPYMPTGIVSVTSFSACTPLEYVLEIPRICSSIVGSKGVGDQRGQSRLNSSRWHFRAPEIQTTLTPLIWKSLVLIGEFAPKALLGVVDVAEVALPIDERSHRILRVRALATL